MRRPRRTARPRPASLRAAPANAHGCDTRHSPSNLDGPWLSSRAHSLRSPKRGQMSLPWASGRRSPIRVVKARLGPQRRMGDWIDRRITNRKLPRPVERDGGLAEADLSDAVRGNVGLRGRSLGLGPATIPEREKDRKCDAEASCHGRIDPFSCKKAAARTIRIFRGTWNLPLRSLCSWSIQMVNPVAAAFRAGQAATRLVLHNESL